MKLTTSSLNRLKGVHPDLVKVVKRPLKPRGKVCRLPLNGLQRCFELDAI
ncbi:MAG: hypothetical protein ABJP66_06905 [Hyphomicrobiales bacterium]